MRTDRYDYIFLPKEFHQSHDNCEFLISQIEDFIEKPEFEGLQKINIILKEDHEMLKDENTLDYLLRIGEKEQHDAIVAKFILHATIIDIVYFLKEAFMASLKKRLTVTFALLRKPLIYDLLVVLRTGLTSDFIDRFNTEEKFDTADLTSEDKMQLLKISEDCLFSKAIKAEDIYKIIFDSKERDSILNLSHRALHPSTTWGKINLTEKGNLNFIFSNEDDIQSQWGLLYSKMPLLLMYMVEVLESIVFDHLSFSEVTYRSRITERAFYLKH
jgi:hypothetical protein